MYLTRILFDARKMLAAKREVFKSLSNLKTKTARQTERLETFKKETASQIFNQIKIDLSKRPIDHQTYWDNLRSKNSGLFKLKIQNANFENKFLDLIYEFKIKDSVMLNSLKDYFIHKKVDQNRIQKSAYGQILLMLKSIEKNKSNDYDEIIENIYTELRNDNLINEQVCSNFLIEYARSTLERLERVRNDYLQNKVNFDELKKRIEFLEILLDYEKYDDFFKLFTTLVTHDDLVLRFFRSKSHQIKDEQIYIRFLTAINDVQVHFQTKDLDNISAKLARFGYKSASITPKTMNCPNCNELMPKIEMKDIEKLKKYFLTKFLDASKNWPNQKSRNLVRAYIEFLENRQNFFDLVIDGLNLGFQGKVDFTMIDKETVRGGIQLKTSIEFFDSNVIELLNQIIKTRLYNRILFICRYRQANSKNLTDFFIKHNIRVRFFEPHVNDDISVILAALYSPNSRILTNDFFEDHMNEIEDLDLRRLFFQFLFSRHQAVMRKSWMLNYHNEGWIKKVYHNSDTETIHIPFDSENDLYRRMFIWQCFRKC